MTTSSPFLRRSLLLNGLFVIEGGSNFLLDVALAAALGVGIRSDSLYAAWTLPMTLGRGAFQSLTNSFMGLFAESEDDEASYSYAITVIGLASFGLALLMSLTSQWWFPLSVPGAGAETWLEGTPLAAILSWLVALLALAETQRAIYYRLGKNAFPSAARVIGVIVSIMFILVSGREQNIRLIAYGLVCGAGIETLLGFVGLAAIGQRLRWAWPPTNKLVHMGQVVGLPLIGQLIRIFAGTAERAIASYLGPGSLTAVSYANRIISTMERFIFRGFVISTIQSYTSRATANWRRDIRLLLLISIPITIILAVLPTPLITIVFERGRFTAESTQLVATTLRFYALAIPVLAFSRVPNALAYAKTMSRVLLLNSILLSLILVGGEIILILLGIGLPAFGIANVLALIASAYWFYTKAMDGADTISWPIDEILRLAASALIALTGTMLIVYIIEAQTDQLASAAWFTVIIGSITSLFLTVVAAWVFRLPEANRIADLLHWLQR